MPILEKPQGPAADGGLEQPLEPPPPVISPLRVALLLVAIAALLFGAWRLIVGDSSAAGARSDAAPVYAPYVDVTLTPTYPFQLPAANPVSSDYLGFVVSSASAPCTPTWGNFYTLDQAEQALDLDSRATQLRNQGGSVAISFGGRDNSELAVGCTDPGKLRAAYLAPIRRYHATAVDLDLEGASLTDPAADARRAHAIATIQRRLAAAHRPLRVWLTLPVSSHGLTAEGIAAVRAMLEAKVRLAGVNAMAMDFGPDEGAEGDMVGTIERALEATHGQIQSLWRAAGLPSGNGAAWGYLGVTVMLGVNDTPGQRFTIADAGDLSAYVNRHGIPRVSVWSLNRDSACGGAFPRVGVLSDTCSGVAQEPLQFTHIFGRLRGTKTARREPAATSQQRQPLPRSTDDPATSPYPIWRPTAAYVSGYKVVWQGQVYEASWWNQGTPPGGAASGSSPGPWQPIGPVPAGSRAPRPILLASGHYPAWAPGTVYHEGDRVSFEGLPYRARWYTQGEQPLGELPVGTGEPWEPLFNYPGEPAESEATAAAKRGR